MIKLYGPTETEFETNGIKILKPFKAEVFKEDNGEYYLDIEDNVGNIDYYLKDYIVRVPTPWGEQGFRIKDITKKTSRIICRAYHLFYDSANYVVADANIVDKNCNYALDHLNSNCDTTTPFDTSSDITNIKSFRPVRKSLEEAVNMCLENYGGHLIRDNFSIKINSSMGQDRGVTLAYGKNITEIEAVENWENVCTKIMPTTTYNQQVYKLANLYLTSENTYDIPYTKVIEFENELSDEDYKDEDGNVDIDSYETALLAWLQEKGKQYLLEHNVPEVNYTLKAHLNNVADVGDTIRVKHPKIKIDLITHVLSVTYDCIRGKYKEIEFGNFKNKLSNLVTNFNNKINEVEDKVNKNAVSIVTKSLNDAAKKIVNSLNGYNIYEASRFLAMDTDNIETAQKILIINKNGIALGTNGINGDFNGVLSINGELDFNNIKALNLLASLIKCDNLKVGAVDGQDGNIELYDATGRLICTQDKEGIKMFTNDGGTLKINPTDGVAFYSKSGTKIWWADGEIFHTKKFEAEDEFTLGTCRILPITTKDANGNIINSGIGFVSLI